MLSEKLLGSFLGYFVNEDEEGRVAMDDLISRQEVLDYIDSMPSELTADGRRMIRRIRLIEYIQDSIPSVQPTLYGYKIEHLALIARVMEKEGVSPEKAVETFQNIVGIVQMIADEQKEIIRKAVESWTV